MSHDNYQSPFSARYSSAEMQYLFSEEHKFRTWRRLWIALAEAENELGLPVTKEQIEELRAHADDINLEVAEAREREVRHDVMSHVFAYGEQCPLAKGIIHLGATSCYVGDNSDLVIYRKGLRYLRRELLDMCDKLQKPMDRLVELALNDKTVAMRTKGVGLLPTADAIRLGAVGPHARASGVNIDVRRDSPYSS